MALIEVMTFLGEIDLRTAAVGRGRPFRMNREPPAGEELFFGGNRRYRVLDVVPFEDADELGVRGDAAGRGGLGFPVAEPPIPEESDKALGEQLARTGADIRALGEQLGAIAPGEAKEYSLRRARITLVVVVAVATFVGWLLWSHWHALWVFLAPLVWIFVSGWRHQRRLRSRR
jgi:hypothetical protein